jgi:peroxin-6
MVRTLSVARVASPFSTDRAYQALFLRALKQYFEGAKRLVKQGDMIAVGIDTDALRRLHDNEATTDDALEPDEPDTNNHM